MRIALGWLLVSAVSLADPPPASKKDARELSLDDLLNTPVEVATHDARTTREAPGVITALTREEILASGARDLLEVLELIPGFSFHSDVEGVVGAGFRGMWGHEGKVLLLIDGIEMNDLLYSDNEFGNHVPVHIIERVEVIRGPGSAVYGGNAELAVINVITRHAKDLQGFEVAGRYSQMSRTYADRTVGLSGGWQFEGSGLELWVNGTFGQGHRSQLTYTDLSGNTADLAQASNLDPMLFTLGAKWHGLTVHLMYDGYTVGTQDGYGPVEPTSEQESFRTIAADVRYELKQWEKVTPAAYFQWRLQTPWEVKDVSSDLFYTKTAQRLKGGLSVDLPLLPSLDILVGAEGYGDMAWLNSTMITGTQTSFNGNNTVSYGNFAAYAQLLWDNPWVNLAVGGRYEWNSAVGSNFAPRIALTKRVEGFHIKLLYSGAFRSPGIENININPSIGAEHVQVGEAEVGLQMSDVLYASANVFYMRLTQPIIYGVDPATVVEQYFNAGPVATGGYELELQARGKFGFGRLTYSMAVPSQNDVPTYQVPGHPEAILGFATHKVTLLGKLHVWRGLSLGGSAVYFSERYGYLTPSGMFDDQGNPIPVIALQPEALLANAWVGYEDLGLKGVTVQLGVNNLFDAQSPFIQPYTSGHAPLPGLSRAFFLRLSYAWQRDAH
jgi:outer membrane receptor protein involved in Fe transport